MPRKRLALAARSHQAAGAGACIFTVLEDRGSGNERRAIAVDALNEAATTGGQVMDDLGLVQAQPVEVDDVDVGAKAGLEPAAIVEAEEIRGFAGLHLDQLR